MDLYYKDSFRIKYKDNCGNCEAYHYILKDLQKEKDVIAYVTGIQADAVALTAALLINNNIKTVLLPWPIAQKGIINKYKLYHYGGVDVYAVKDARPDHEWILGMFTSGSTGNPKLFGFTADQINKTLDWYHMIYKVDAKSLVITAMPVTYNFSFIAGVCNMASVGGTFVSADVSMVPDIIEQEGTGYNRIVILANPVLMDNFSDRLLKYNQLNLLIDSGGSPLSKKAIEIYRSNGIDLREGYGLTETCSLTHFDTEAVEESIGTVGSGMEGVRVGLEEKEQKYFAKLYTPNLGRELSYEGEWLGLYEEGYLTTDIVRTDDKGRLELLGRAADTCINGYWPKDTLDLIGDLIGVNCALVQHIRNCVVITFLKEDIKVDMDQIKALVHERLEIDKDYIKLFINDSEMLHSMKIKRKSRIV